MELDAQFWVSLLQIIWIDILLSGDNAVVIALAVRSLPEHQKRWGIILGAGAAIGLRVVFAVFIVYLLEIPYLKVVGAVLLLWIAVKLMLPQDEHHDNVEGGANLYAAIRTIVIADAVMSLDNVIAIAAAAHGSVVLLILGLLISIPLIVFGSTLVLRALDRFPLLVYFGAALLGYIAGELIVTDPATVAFVEHEAPYLHYVAPVAGAVLVVVVGYFLARARKPGKTDPVPAVSDGGRDS